MEATPRDGDDADIDEYPDELYEMYGSPPPGNRYGSNRHSDRRASSRRRDRSQSRRRPQYISEGEEDDDFGPSNTSSLSDFEMLNSSRPTPRPRSRNRPSRSRGQSRRAPELKNIRVKVHHEDDTRYVMVGSAVVFEDFVDRVREKFGVRTRFRLKVRDEGDYITLGDGDDWDLCLANVRKEAQGEGADLGKLEVSLMLPLSYRSLSLSLARYRCISLSMRFYFFTNTYRGFCVFHLAEQIGLIRPGCRYGFRRHESSSRFL